MCFWGEIDACSLDIGMKIDTFVDFISTWINLPRQKIFIFVEYTSYRYPICSNIILQIYDIQQSILRKGPAF